MGAQSKLIPPPPIVRSTYRQRVRQNILPLSKARTLPQAFTEWHFTEDVRDHEEPSATCELCDKRGLRYHFHIQNDYTHCGLWVGSTCILRFDIAVLEGGVRLNRAGAQRKLDGLKRKKRYYSCIKALKRVAEKESNNSILSNALFYYDQHKHLTPKFAACVFWRLRHYKIDYNPKYFKVRLKEERDKQAMCQMPSNRVNMFWSALSPSQRRIAARLGHSGPNGGGR